MKEFKLKFIYKNGDADDGKLNLYDGAKSLEGIARAMNITIHAFINEEVRLRAESATGATLYLRAPQRGSFIYEASIFIAGAASSGMAYDFIKYTFNEAIGIILDEPESRSLQRKIEPTFGELPAVLESALVDVHRPINRNPEMTLTVARPRGKELITFDSNTAKVLQPVRINIPDYIIGHVTKYNSISGWGRIYDMAEERVISFHLHQNSTEVERALITWSLHQNNIGEDGKLYMRGDADVSQLQQNKIKRYLISSVTNIPG